LQGGKAFGPPGCLMTGRSMSSAGTTTRLAMPPWPGVTLAEAPGLASGGMVRRALGPGVSAAAVEGSWLGSVAATGSV